MRSLGWINFCLRTDVPDVWIVFFFAFNQITQIEFVFAQKNMSLRLNDEKAENKGVEIRIKKNNKLCKNVEMKDQKLGHLTKNV